MNIGRFENKYPLHSRFMHYFTPAVQSALSLVERRGVRGKLDALRAAKNVFPQRRGHRPGARGLSRYTTKSRSSYEEPKLAE